jgi:hypothetical protein
MTYRSKWVRVLTAFAVLAGMASTAEATTLERRGLEDLVATNATVVLGEVVDLHSYWNDGGTFILTDVRVAPREVVKGKVRSGELTFTMLGGTVGELTTLIVGGPVLVPGRTYLLFLDRDDLPGAAHALTVRDHAQGVFDVRSAREGLRAVSQAHDHPLVPDLFGRTDAPGGVEGLPLDAMLDSIRDLARSQDREEVK